MLPCQYNKEAASIPIMCIVPLTVINSFTHLQTLKYPSTAFNVFYLSLLCLNVKFIIIIINHLPIS